MCTYINYWVPVTIRFFKIHRVKMNLVINNSSVRLVFVINVLNFVFAKMIKIHMYFTSNHFIDLYILCTTIKENMKISKQYYCCL